MKRKSGLILIMTFFCLLLVSSFVKADSFYLSPNQYNGLGKDLNFADELNFHISSYDVGVNVYIMTYQQIQTYQNNPNDIASAYYKEWKGIITLTESFIAPEDGIYYILIINPSDIETIYISITASVDYYYPPEPETETEYIYITSVRYDYNSWFLMILVGSISIITILIILKKKNKQIRELIK